MGSFGTARGSRPQRLSTHRDVPSVRTLAIALTLSGTLLAVLQVGGGRPGASSPSAYKPHPAASTTTQATSQASPFVGINESGNTELSTTTTAARPQSQSTTTTSQPSPPPPAAPGGVITASGDHLILNKRFYQFVGVNAYEIATDWGVNGSCGTMESNAQLDDLFASLPPNSLVRFWAWQGSAAINIHTHQLDWAPLDRVFSTATTYHQRLIVVLGGQSGACDGGNWKDPTWYDGGFMQVQNATGLTPLSYWDYLQAIVTRYRNSPALGMWEPMSEPEASTCPPQYQPSNCGGHQTCPDEAVAEAALIHFFDTVGGDIHSLDPTHLVESGMIGSGQCGTSGPDYESVSASPGINVLSYHDYDGATPVGGDQWNGLALRFREAAALVKPIIGGEVGLMAGTGQGCTSPQARVAEFRLKEDDQLQAGSSGLLVWDWEPTPPSQSRVRHLSRRPARRRHRQRAVTETVESTL